MLTIGQYIFLIFLGMTYPLMANELILSAQDAEAFGAPAPMHRPMGSLPSPTPKNLPWPLEEPLRQPFMGNVMTQFADFGSVYFHGGCDLLARKGTKVYAPVSGRLFAGHYSYQVKEDGSLQKHWRPWPKWGPPQYFEIAIEDEFGYRYELHHVDRRSLPSHIVAALNSKDPRVEAGEWVGSVVAWPTNYAHIHYNIIHPQGYRLNPETHSLALNDFIPPTIEKVFVKDTSGRVQLFAGGLLSTRPEEFVVMAYDQRKNQSLIHSPTYLSLSFENGHRSLWDFRQALLNSEGRFPHIWDFYLKELRFNGRRYYSQGGYPYPGENTFLMRLPVPKEAYGKFRIEISDSANNTTKMEGELLRNQQAGFGRQEGV